MELNEFVKDILNNERARIAISIANGHNKESIVYNTVKHFESFGLNTNLAKDISEFLYKSVGTREIQEALDVLDELRNFDYNS